MEDRLISTRELATRLSLSVRTVRTLAKAGRIPAVRVTRNRLRFEWSDVLATLHRSARTEATPEGGRRGA